jgi:hypothetical protein
MNMNITLAHYITIRKSVTVCLFLIFLELFGAILLHPVVAVVAIFVTITLIIVVIICPLFLIAIAVHIRRIPARFRGAMTPPGGAENGFFLSSVAYICQETCHPPRMIPMGMVPYQLQAAYLLLAEAGPNGRHSISRAHTKSPQDQSKASLNRRRYAFVVEGLLTNVNGFG